MKAKENKFQVETKKRITNKGSADAISAHNAEFAEIAINGQINARIGLIADLKLEVSAASRALVEATFPIKEITDRKKYLEGIQKARNLKKEKEAQLVQTEQDQEEYKELHKDLFG